MRFEKQQLTREGFGNFSKPGKSLPAVALVFYKVQNKIVELNILFVDKKLR